MSAVAWDPGDLEAFLAERTRLPQASAKPRPVLMPAGLDGIIPWLVEFARGAQPDGDRSRQSYHLVRWALEKGCRLEQVHALAGVHAPSIAKYGNRLAAEIDRLLGKLS